MVTEGQAEKVTEGQAEKVTEGQKCSHHKKSTQNNQTVLKTSISIKICVLCSIY